MRRQLYGMRWLRWLMACAMLVGSVAIAQGGPPPSLAPGQRLYRDQGVSSLNGVYTLYYQFDGNLVLYHNPGIPIWASNTAGTCPGYVEMQVDGNFVIYDCTGTPIWASGTDGFPGAYLVVQNDGNMVIYLPDCTPIWDTGTAGQ